MRKNKKNQRKDSDAVATKGDIYMLEDKFALLGQDVDILKNDVSILKSDVSTLKTDVNVLKSDVESLKTDVSGLKSDVSSLRDDLSSNNKSLNAKIDRQYILLVEEMKRRDDELYDRVERMINIKFAEQADNHAQLMTFLYEHFPVQQKQIHEHSVRLDRIEQILDIKA